MIELERTVRFCINPTTADRSPAPGPTGHADRGEDATCLRPPEPDDRRRLSPGGPVDAAAPRSNTFSAWPPMRGLGRYYELEVTCRGEPDPDTGYFMNIKRIDEAVRERVLPLVADAVQAREASACPTRLIREMWPRLNEALGGSLRQIRWRLTPYYAVCLEPEPETGLMSLKQPQVVVRQHFEFAASHRLHVDAYTPEENRACFGKCNNPNGHGHNYRLEVAVRLPAVGTAEAGPDQRPFSVGELDRIVDTTVIERFDHKHLNLDCPEFVDLNPSVENIARVCFDLLAGPVQAQGMSLKEVTVWETEKTRCTYPA